MATGRRDSDGSFGAVRLMSFEPGTLTYFSDNHFFLARKENGEFVALYDLDSHVQNLIASGDSSQERCRLNVSNTEPAVSRLKRAIANGSLESVPGMEEKALTDPCYRDTFNAVGNMPSVHRREDWTGFR